MNKIKAYYFFIAGAVLLIIGYFLTVREVRAEYEDPEADEQEEQEEQEETEVQPKKRRKKDPTGMNNEPVPDATIIQDAEIITPDEKQG